MLLFAVSNPFIEKKKKKNVCNLKGDSIHCCPHGYTCNMEENKCEKGSFNPMVYKQRSNSSKSSIKINSFAFIIIITFDNSMFWLDFSFSFERKFFIFLI